MASTTLPPMKVPEKLYRQWVVRTGNAILDFILHDEQESSIRFMLCYHFLLKPERWRSM